MFSRLLFFTCCLFSMFAALAGETELEKTKRFFPGFISPLPLKLELPANYEPFPMDPKHGDPNIALGVYWMDREDYEEMQHLSDADDQWPRKPCFKVGLTQTVGQIGPDQSTITDEVIQKEMQRLDVKELQMQDIFWGLFPVKTISGVFPNGRPLYMALVGLEIDEGYFMSIVFINSRAGDNFANEKKIWTNFIDKTRMLKDEELIEALGYNIQQGRTVYTNHDSQIELIGERVAGEKKVAIKITPLTKDTTFRTIQTEVPAEQDKDEDFIVVNLIMNIEIEPNNTLATEVNIPVSVTTVEQKTLKGENVFEDEAAIILSGAN